MGSFWLDNAPKQYTGGSTTIQGSPQSQPTQDFNLGGYQPQTPNPYENDWSPRNPDGSLVTGPLVGPDPRVTTQPQPWQKLPSFQDNFSGGQMPPQPQPYQQGPGGSLGQMPQGPYGGSNGWNDMGSHPMPAGFDPAKAAADAQTKSPWVLPGNQQMFNQAQGRGSLGQMGNGGFYAPPAIRKGPNGGFVDPGTGQPYGGTQPMNPGQQSGQVGMRSPDGQHFQYVNAEHVPHYQSRGATVYNGSSYGGGNG